MSREDYKTYNVKCPICGKEMCDCIGESHINIKCKTCNTVFTIIRNKNDLMIKENIGSKCRA